MIRVEAGDCLDIIPRLVSEGIVVDSVVTDPPYHLTATAKRFGAVGSAPAQYGKDGAMARLSGGFMGQQWDGGDIAFRQQTWGIVSSIMRPGAFLLAFGGTRTFHRLTCAIEDAGFVIQDCLMFMFGTGFPKRRDMLKPAWEPIIMAYKPAGKRSLGVDECRIPCDDKTPFPVGATSADGSIMTGLHSKPREDDTSPAGRWPANVCHDGSDEVMEAFAAFGERSSGVLKAGTQRNSRSVCYGKMPDTAALTDFGGDTGSVARFFYCAKADKQDRWGSKHPTVKPVELMKWLVPLVTRPDGVVLDCFAGSGTAGVAALATGRSAILIDQGETYVADIRERMAFYEGTGRHSLVSKNRNAVARAKPGPLL